MRDPRSTGSSARGTYVGTTIIRDQPIPETVTKDYEMGAKRRFSTVSRLSFGRYCIVSESTDSRNVWQENPCVSQTQDSYLRIPAWDKYGILVYALQGAHTIL